MEGILAIVVQALPLLVEAAKAGLEVNDIVDKITSAHASSAEPTSAEWQAVDAAIVALRQQLNTDPPES